MDRKTLLTKAVVFLLIFILLSIFFNFANDTYYSLYPDLIYIAGLVVGLIGAMSIYYFGLSLGDKVKFFRILTKIYIYLYSIGAVILIIMRLI